MEFKIIIPEPCHEDWNGMTPEDKGKFCGACSKVVIDFSKYSDEELISFLAQKREEKTCGRFRVSQLEKTYETPSYIYSPAVQRMPYIKQFALAFLVSFGAMLSSCNTETSTTGKVETTIQDTTQKELTGDTTFIQIDSTINQIEMGEIAPLPTPDTPKTHQVIQHKEVCKKQGKNTPKETKHVVGKFVAPRVVEPEPVIMGGIAPMPVMGEPVLKEKSTEE